MNIKRYDIDSVNALYDSYFQSVQNAIKDILLKNPYNVSADDIEEFNEKMIKQNDNNENTIKSIVAEGLDKKISNIEIAKKIIELYYKKTIINYFNKDSEQDIQTNLREKQIIKFSNFINESYKEDYNYDITLSIIYSHDHFNFKFQLEGDDEDANAEIELVNFFEKNNLNTQKNLTYIAYLINSNFGDLHRIYNTYVDDYENDLFLTLSTYSTIENFEYELLENINIINCNNLDVFIDNELKIFGNSILENQFLFKLFKFTTKAYQLKMKHIFNAKKFDLI